MPLFWPWIILLNRIPYQLLNPSILGMSYLYEHIQEALDVGVDVDVWHVDEVDLLKMFHSYWQSSGKMLKDV
jgi:hypothetical protein